MASPAPIPPAPSDAQAWRDALEAMKPTTSPCPSMTGPRWQVMREAAIGFLDRFGDNAIALGLDNRTSARILAACAPTSQSSP